MIRIPSTEWDVLITKLKRSRTKSNRDTLCVKCWKIMNYNETKDHKKNKPLH